MARPFACSSPVLSGGGFFQTSDASEYLGARACLASSADYVTAEGGPTVAAMIRPAGDIEDAAGTLRVIFPLDHGTRRSDRPGGAV